MPLATPSFFRNVCSLSSALKCTLHIVTQNPFTQEASIRQLEDDVNCCRRIDRLSFSLRRFKFDLLSSANCILIKPVAQSANDLEYTHITRRCEKHMHQDFAL